MTHETTRRKTTTRPAARRHWRASLLDNFCAEEEISTADLAAAAFVSPQHIGRLRAGKAAGVTIQTAKLLAKGASRILGRKVAVGELFDLD